MQKPTVFVIMPFEDEFFDSYDMIANHFGEKYYFSNAAKEDNQQNILGDVIKPILEADVILADLTSLNPNVMYELGIAHAFNKKTIVITRDELSKLPFDLKQYRTKGYSTHFKDFQELLEYLSKNLDGAIDGSVVFNNPVSDFADSEHISLDQVIDKQTIEIDIPETEKGFIDFIAEIEEDLLEMTGFINAIGTDLNDLNSNTEKCAKEIERVNDNGGSGTASFVRKQAKKVADNISRFTDNFHHNKDEIYCSWQNIEKNTYGLLENKFSTGEFGNDSLEAFIQGLVEIKQSIEESDNGLLAMKQSLLSIIGLEKNLNHSIKALDKDIEGYFEMTSQIVSSVDRIERKYKMLAQDDID